MKSEKRSGRTRPLDRLSRRGLRLLGSCLVFSLWFEVIFFLFFWVILVRPVFGVFVVDFSFPPTFCWTEKEDGELYW